MQPDYYVKHPDGSYSLADPQPKEYAAFLETERTAAALAIDLADARRDADRYRFVRTADKVSISAEAARDPVAYDGAIDAAMRDVSNPA